jgi:hypothetical protein
MAGASFARISRQRMTQGAIIFTLAVATTFYSVGATFVEAWLNYPTWTKIGTATFRDYHRALSRRSVPLIVMPFAAAVTFTVLLLWQRPVTVPRPSIFAILALELIVVLVSVFSQIPLQRRFDREGWSRTDHTLLVRREWARKLPLIAVALIMAWLLVRVSE